MKRTLIVLLLLAIVMPLFADDALILPNRVIRFRTIPSLSLTSAAFDTDGKRDDLVTPIDLSGFGLGIQNFETSANVWALSFALEIGVTDNINIAAQWTPGWQFASTTTADAPSAVPGAIADPTVESIENAQQTGLDDLFVGAKAQILGEDGFVPNENMRFALALGGIIPLSIYDADEAAEAQADGDEYQAGRVGNDVYAVGARLYYDYILTETAFINLFSETQLFLPRELDDGAGDVEYAYGYKQSFEIDPQISYPLSDGLRLGASLATRYSFTPDIEVDGDTVDDSATQLLAITPQVSAFFLGLPVPIEAKLQYTYPIYGVNVNATNTIAMQINTYLAF